MQMMPADANVTDRMRGQLLVILKIVCANKSIAININKIIQNFAKFIFFGMLTRPSVLKVFFVSICNVFLVLQMYIIYSL